jgi:hypothetical protein
LDSPWPQLRAAVSAFLRHSQSGYEEQLRTRAGYDPVLRDQLAAQVEVAARRAYPWLDRDPRPFPTEEKAAPTLVLDRMASRLAEFHTRADQLRGAISDLRRDPDHDRSYLAALRQELSTINQRIADYFDAFKMPAGKGNRSTSAVVGPHPDSELGHYFWCGQNLAENHFVYAGFKCEACGAAVMRTKRAISLGAGRLAITFSCHCASLSADPLTIRKLIIDPEQWAAVIEAIKERYE